MQVYLVLAMLQHVRIPTLPWLVVACLTTTSGAWPGNRQLHQIPPNTAVATQQSIPSAVEAEISKVTQPPSESLARQRLQARQNNFSRGPGTCGWSQENGISYTCITEGAVCTSESGYVGCCETDKDCSVIKTKCINYAGVQDGDCNLPDDFHTLCCASSELGECYTLFLSASGPIGDGGGIFTLFNCDSTAGAGALLDRDPAWGNLSSTSRSTIPVTPEPIGNDDDEPDVGAIAGGTVGGVAGLAIIGGGILMYLRRRKQKKQAEGASGQLPQGGDGDGQLGFKPELEANSGAVFTGPHGSAYKKRELEGSTNAISEVPGSEAVYEMPGSEFRGWELAAQNNDGDGRSMHANAVSAAGDDASRRPKIQRKPVSGSSNHSNT